MDKRHMTHVIVIPVKRLDEAKGRLASTLAPEDRRVLGLTMLADVLRATEKWEERIVVTSDPDAEAVGYAFACNVVSDRGLGLNEAILDGVTHASMLNSQAVLILPADVPLAASDEITNLFNDPADVVIAESRDGGTNALRIRPPQALTPNFGPHSAAAHAKAAADAGLSYRIERESSFELDVDVPADLEALARSDSQRQSALLARALLDRGRPGASDGPKPHRKG